MTDPIDSGFSGEKLYGDDFGPAEIAAGFDDERAGCAGLGQRERGGIDTYGSPQPNVPQGFRRLPGRRWGRVLGVRSACAGEFLPIRDRLGEVAVLEPSATPRSTSLNRGPLRYVEPAPGGDMPFAAESFDLVVSPGTLHHVPNVSHIVSEIGRVAACGGWVLIRGSRSPRSATGAPRRGLTRRERGLPPRLFRRMFAAAGLRVVRDEPCMFPTTPRLAAYGLGVQQPPGAFADSVLSRCGRGTIGSTPPRRGTRCVPPRATMSLPVTDHSTAAGARKSALPARAVVRSAARRCALRSPRVSTASRPGGAP